MTKIIVTTSERYIADLANVLALFYRVDAGTITENRDDDDVLLTPRPARQ